MNDFVINGAAINGSAQAGSVARTISISPAAIVVAGLPVALNSARTLGITTAAIAVNGLVVNLVVTRAGLTPHVPSIIKCKVSRFAGEPDPRRALVKAL